MAIQFCRRAALPFAATLIGLIAGAGCGNHQAADFTLPSSDGTSFTLSSAKDQNGVVLFFFASWCASCAELVPEVIALAEATGGGKVAVYGVSIQETQEVIDKYVVTKEINFPILLDAETAAAAAFGIQGIPTIIGVDIKGNIVYRGHSMPEDTATFLGNLAGGA